MNHSELVRALLAKRGLTDARAIDAFLNPDYEKHTHSPLLLHGMDKAAVRLLAAISGGERIAVYADFDCDGIPGAALLSDFFAKVGYGNVEIYIPHRDREGYGLHKEAIEELAGRGTGLIITVDVGTTAHEAIECARGKGMDVIVTDHHEPSREREAPPALAILNPKLNGYPFPHLCGAAVAWKFVQAALAEGKRRGISGFANVPAGWEKWLLDLVALATVADMVPLVGENRVLALFGLAVLRKSPRPGIRALCNRLRLRQSELSEDDIGFSIAPRINAASRMDEPDLAFRLLTTRDPNEAEQIAARLEALNARRKGAVASIVREAKKRVHERFRADERIVVLGDTEWKPALLGLAANSILESERRLPAGQAGGRQVVCLWGRDARGRLRGSCRSGGGVSVVELFANAPGAVLEYGGHRLSCGFSVSHESVHTLAAALARSMEDVSANPAPAGGAPAEDSTISLSEMSPRLFEEVSRLSPFGIGNPKPVFLVVRAAISSVRRFGKENNHVEVLLSCERTGVSARAFDFFKSPESFTHTPAIGHSANILATLEKDSYRGGLALRIVDIVPAA